VTEATPLFDVSSVIEPAMGLDVVPEGLRTYLQMSLAVEPFFFM
jgi:hypothetical protein